MGEVISLAHERDLHETAAAMMRRQSLPALRYLIARLGKDNKWYLVKEDLTEEGCKLYRDYLDRNPQADTLGYAEFTYLPGEIEKVLHTQNISR